MVMTAAILGAGDLGGAIAHALAARDVFARIVLIDDAAGVAGGKALDIQQAGAISGVHTRLEGSADLDRAIGSAVCIVADPAGQTAEHDRPFPGDLERLTRSVGDAPIVFTGATHSVLMLEAGLPRSVRLGGPEGPPLHPQGPPLLPQGPPLLPRARVVGSAPEALASAIRSIVAMEARCSPGEVMLPLLGAAGNFVVPWSQASIGGYALEQVLSTVERNRIEARAAKLWPPGPYALGLAAALVAEAIVHSSRRTFSLMTVLDGEFGFRNRLGVLPVVLSTTGIVHRRVPNLSTRERVLVETALAG